VRPVTTVTCVKQSLIPNRLVEGVDLRPPTFSRHRQVLRDLVLGRVLTLSAARPLSSTALALRQTPSASLNASDSSPSTTTPVTALAQRGSNQLSLETPRNGAGE
jgi:hypothetical protein